MTTKKNWYFFIFLINTIFSSPLFSMNIIRKSRAFSKLQKSHSTESNASEQVLRFFKLMQGEAKDHPANRKIVELKNGAHASVWNVRRVVAGLINIARSKYGTDLDDLIENLSCIHHQLPSAYDKYAYDKNEIKYLFGHLIRYLGNSGYSLNKTEINIILSATQGLAGSIAATHPNENQDNSAPYIINSPIRDHYFIPTVVADKKYDPETYNSIYIDYENGIITHTPMSQNLSRIIDPTYDVVYKKQTDKIDPTIYPVRDISEYYGYKSLFQMLGDLPENPIMDDNWITKRLKEEIANNELNQNV